MYLHEPSRGGTRGGKDQFTWKNVEADKYRENYLANSLMAPVGRWQKGRDLTWYTKDTKIHGKKGLKMELEAVKQAEEEAMTRALGIKSGPLLKPTEKLSKEEIAEVCKRRTDDDDIPAEKRMKGVGYKNQRLNSLMDSSVSVSNDGVTKFEQDPRTSKNTDKLILKQSCSYSKTVPMSSDQSQLSTLIKTSEEIHLPAKKKKKKKHTLIDFSDDEQCCHHGKKFKKKRKKKRDSCSNNESTAEHSDEGKQQRHSKKYSFREMERSHHHRGRKMLSHKCRSDSGSSMKGKSSHYKFKHSVQEDIDKQRPLGYQHQLKKRRTSSSTLSTDDETRTAKQGRR